MYVAPSLCSQSHDGPPVAGTLFALLREPPSVGNCLAFHASSGDALNLTSTPFSTFLTPPFLLFSLLQKAFIVQSSPRATKHFRSFSEPPFDHPSPMPESNAKPSSSGRPQSGAFQACTGAEGRRLALPASLGRPSSNPASHPGRTGRPEKGDPQERFLHGPWAPYPSRVRC